MSSINDILAYVPLTEAVQTIKGGLPRVLPDDFYNLTENVVGTKARLIEFNGQRQSARVSPDGSPPKVRGKLTLDDKALVLLSSCEEMEFTEELLEVLCDWEDYKPQQDRAMRNVAYQGEGFRTIFENLETFAILSTFACGNIYLDVDGNPLAPTATGGAPATADNTVAQGVPTINTGQLAGLGLLTGDFNNPNFDIVTYLSQKLLPYAVGQTNWPIGTAIYGGNIPGYMNRNESTKRAWAFQESYATKYLSNGEVPPNFLGEKGIRWINGSQMYFVDQNGVSQFIFPPDQIVFGPAISKATYTNYIGSTRVPTQFGPLPTGEAALKSFTEVQGRYRMAYIPQGGTFKVIDQGGSKFLPRLKQPNAWYFLSINP
jgi:hypothetical protein